MVDVHEELAFLTDSPHRRTVLSLLSESHPRTRGDLATRLDATRRTVNRTVAALDDRGYVEETPEGYRLTAYGATLAEAYEAFVSEAATGTRLSPFLSHVPSDVFDLDPRLLEDADLLLATETSPFALLDRTLRLRRAATTVREIAPAVERKSVAQLADRLRAEEPIDVEVVLPAETAVAAETNRDYRDEHRTIAASDRVDLYVYPDSTSLFVGIFDETVTLGVVREGRPYALLESSNSPVHDWAMSTFRSFRERARVTPTLDASHE